MLNGTRVPEGEEGGGRVGGTGRVGGLSAAVLPAMLVAAAAGAGAAQEPESPSGWIGVGLQEFVSCVASERAAARCERGLLVTQVFVGSPADRGGLEPGDTLVSLDGRPIRGARDAAFGVLRPGREVRVQVGREAGRRALTVVPERRPGNLSERAIRRYLPSVASAWAPAAERSPAPPAVGPAEAAPGEGGRWIRIRVDSDSVRVGPLARAEAAGEAGVGVVRVEPGVWAELDLGPRLRALRDSVFLRARVHLDSIRRRWHEERAREGLARVHSYAWTGLPEPLERRLAGAEFAALNPELAEAIEGPDRGLLVLRVLPGTPAARVGLRPGDVVIEAGGRRCEALDDLRHGLEHSGESGALVVKWVRKGREMTGLFRDE